LTGVSAKLPLCKGVKLMPIIKDKKYKQFLQTGLITPMGKEEFSTLLEKVDHRLRLQARAVAILIYYTGRRPIEIISLPRENIEKQGQYLKIMFFTAKGGRYNVMYYPLRNKHIKEVWTYAQTLFPTHFFGWVFRSHGNKPNPVSYKTSKGIKTKEYKRVNTLLRYHFLKWFGATPYFFRHNRFSLMSIQGAGMQEIKHAKGAKTLKSVEPYMHLSVKKAKKMAKYFN